MPLRVKQMSGRAGRGLLLQAIPKSHTSPYPFTNRIRNLSWQSGRYSSGSTLIALDLKELGAGGVQAVRFRLA